MTPPLFRVGWQTEQAANTKDLTFALNSKNYQSNPRIDPANPSQLYSSDTKKPIYPSATGLVDRADTSNPLTTNYDPNIWAPTAKKY